MLISKIQKTPHHILAVDGSPCLACEKGKWNDSIGGTSCTNCLAGQYNDQTASTSIDACIGCGAGRYANTALAATSCVACEKGKWSDSIAGTSCTNCLAGQYNDQTASTSIDACIDCTAGRYSTVGGAAISSAVCNICRVGAATNTPSRATSCEDCEMGKYNPHKEQVSCTSCLTGTYLPSTGSVASTQCLLCEIGKASDVIGLGTNCADCTPGE